ncbi:hypothetical protein [Nocardia sp. NPDC058666]|uniref:hypothetical protein n=1 Tax=Nocardia sp. NPDC058666 TaxID=3346587 RepID=UPI0036680904
MSDTGLDNEFGPATWAGIEAAWTSWGRLDQDVIAPLINPAFMGGPAWPGLRQAHSITRRTDGILLASSGLADPTTWDDDEPTNGFEVEVYAIASDLPVDSDTMTVAGSWLGSVVMAVSDQVAHLGFRFTDTLTRSRLLTMALPHVELPDVPDHYIDSDDGAVVMIGLTDAEIPNVVTGPLSPIRLVNIKLLTRAEGRFCASHWRGSNYARREVARRLAKQGRPLYSGLNRPSVV